MRSVEARGKSQARSGVIAVFVAAAGTGCALDESGTGVDASVDVAMADVFQIESASDSASDGVIVSQDVVEADAPIDAGFSPAQLTGLALWLRADKNVVLDGAGRVQSWNDLSPNAATAVQSIAAQRPSYINQINGQKTVTFIAPNASFSIAVRSPTVDRCARVCTKRAPQLARCGRLHARILGAYRQHGLRRMYSVH